MDDKLYDKIVVFLNEYSIDTEWYLDSYAKAMIEDKIYTLKEIDKMNGDNKICFLDIEKLYMDEEELIIKL